MKSDAPYQPESPRTYHDTPSIEPRVLAVLREHAAEFHWPVETDNSFSRWAELIRIAVDNAETFDTDWLTGKRRNPGNVRGVLRRMMTQDDRSLALGAAHASDRLQGILREALSKSPRRIRDVDLGVRYPGACELWEPGMMTPTQLRFVIGKILSTKGPGSYRGRPSTEHIDALAEVVVQAYIELSGMQPTFGRSRETGLLIGPLARFAERMAKLCDLPSLSDENRLLAASRKMRTKATTKR